MEELSSDKTPRQSANLHICPDCGSCLVHPLCWEQAGDRSHWRVWRRCPECEWSSQGVYGEHEIDAFVTALASDLITADDFARSR